MPYTRQLSKLTSHILRVLHWCCLFSQVPMAISVIMEEGDDIKNRALNWATESDFNLDGDSSDADVSGWDSSGRDADRSEQHLLFFFF